MPRLVVAVGAGQGSGFAYVYKRLRPRWQTLIQIYNIKSYCDLSHGINQSIHHHVTSAKVCVLRLAIPKPKMNWPHNIRNHIPFYILSWSFLVLFCQIDKSYFDKSYFVLAKLLATSPVVFVCHQSHRVNDVVVDVRCGNSEVVKQLHQFSSSEFAVVAFNADALAIDLQA